MFIVIGGGIAGVTCTEQLAELLPNEQIIIVSASPLVKACINVKKISKVMEDFDVEEKSASYLEENYPNIKVIYAKANSFNSETKELFLSNGEILKYKKLCICIGGTPKLLADNPYVIGIRDTQTVSEFQVKLQDSKRIVVVGNGGIATELTYEIENCEVIWAIRHSSIGATFFDAGAAEFFLPHLSSNKEKPETEFLRRVKYSVSTESASNEVTGSALGPDWSTNQKLKAKNEVKNIHIEYKCEVKRIISHEDIIKNKIEVTRLSENESVDDWPVFVELTNDKVYGCNLVVSATGVVPNSDIEALPQKLKISTEDGGIEVDNQMKTSCNEVYAAGDCCTTTWENSKTWFQMRLWTQARQMGYYAANCIYTNNLNNQDNIPEICFDLFTHVTKFFGYKVILLGLYNCQGLGQDCELLLRMTKGKEYIKVVLQNSRMVGAILIGETDLEETFENLILNQLDLSSYGEDLLNPDVDIEDYFD